MLWLFTQDNWVCDISLPTQLSASRIHLPANPQHETLTTRKNHAPTMLQTLYFAMNQLFASGDQSIRASVLASVLSINIQG